MFWCCRAGGAGEISRWCNHRNTSRYDARALKGRRESSRVLSGRDQIRHTVPVVAPPANFRRPPGTENRQIDFLKFYRCTTPSAEVVVRPSFWHRAPYDAGKKGQSPPIYSQSSSNRTKYISSLLQKIWAADAQHRERVRSECVRELLRRDCELLLNGRDFLRFFQSVFGF